MGTPVHCLPLEADISSNTMKTACVFFLLLACLTALVVSQPSFSKLEKEQRLGCSAEEIQKCEAEIMKAVEDCADTSDLEGIIKCVVDILAMTDCQKCICDVLPIC